MVPFLSDTPMALFLLLTYQTLSAESMAIGVSSEPEEMVVNRYWGESSGEIEAVEAAGLADGPGGAGAVDGYAGVVGAG